MFLQIMNKVIIFDFDGVIADTEKRKFKDILSVLKKENLNVSNVHFEEFIGKKRGHFIGEKYLQISEGKKNKILSELRTIQFDNINEYKLMTGIKELLKFLKKNDYTIAITTGSSKEFVKTILQFHEVETYFKVIISGEMFSKSKPDPECFEITLRKLNIKPSDVIIIEDSIAGVSAAKKAGCKVFGLLTYLEEKHLKEADNIFKNHLEILEFLKEQTLRT